MEPSAELLAQEDTKVTEAARALRRVRWVELALVAFTALGVAVAAFFSGWSAQQIRSCTTPTGKCYRDTTVRARTSNRAAQEELLRQHKVILCVLLVEPALRSEAVEAGCEAKYPMSRGTP